jgi:hypothetical protein
MPSIIHPLKTNLKIKIDGNFFDSTSSNFYSNLEIDLTKYGMEIATLANTTGTEEQTILDTGTGKSGVLTQILCPAITSAGVITVRVTVDGIEKSFITTENITTTNEKFFIGDSLPFDTSTTAGNGTGYGSGLAVSYGTALGRELLFLSPLDSLSRGLPIGMVFRDSLKVTIQTTGAFEVGSATNKAVASFLNFLPEGL